MVENPHYVHLVMEYAPGGDLERRLSRDGPLAEAGARAVFSQLLAAVQHMVSVRRGWHGRTRRGQTRQEPG